MTCRCCQNRKPLTDAERVAVIDRLDAGEAPSAIAYDLRVGITTIEALRHVVNRARKKARLDRATAEALRQRVAAPKVEPTLGELARAVPLPSSVKRKKGMSAC